MDSARLSDSAEVTRRGNGGPRGFSLPFEAPQEPTQAGGGGNSPFRFSNGGKAGGWRLRRAGGAAGDPQKKRGGEKELGPRRPPYERRPVPMATAGSRGRFLDCAAAASDWTQRGAES